jgi:hypothetical protein
LKVKKVILSGGAFGTTRMMTLSGFKSKFPALGKKFASHPQFMWLGFQNEIVDAHKKMFQAVASKDDSFRRKVLSWKMYLHHQYLLVC